MKLIKPYFEEIKKDNMLEQGEICARVCYKSENLIKEGSAKKILKGIADAGHTAMLEHLSVYLEMPTLVLKANYPAMCVNPYTKVRYNPFTGTAYVSTNLRVLHEHYRDLYEIFMDNEGDRVILPDLAIKFCKYEDNPEYFQRRITIKFTMDRIGSQSFCRHRLFSFAQESTRWCNYLKEKFGSEITISEPFWLKEADKEEFIKDMEELETLYFKWINKGYKAEEARYFLPFGLKTEIVMTGFPDAWEHFFGLRNESHAHPQAQELAKPLEEYFIKQGYITK